MAEAENYVLVENAQNKVLLIRRLVNLKLKSGYSMAKRTSEFQDLINQFTSVKMKLDNEMHALLLLTSVGMKLDNEMHALLLLSSLLDS